MAARAAKLMDAERVVVIDRYDNRLEQVHTHIGVETLDYEGLRDHDFLDEVQSDFVQWRP